MRYLLWGGSFALLGWLGIVAAQEKKPELPLVIVANPLGVVPGQTTKVMLRGLKLDEAKEVRFAGKSEGVKLLSATKSAPPNQQEPKRAGDTQVELELTIPAETQVGELPLVVVTPAGESVPYSLLVGAERPLLAEKEPNDSFRQAQAIAISQTIEGVIHAGQNVDVFVVTAEAEQKLVAEVFAARRGSAVDGFLTIFDESAAIVVQNDDQPTSRDPRLTWTAKAGAKYFVVLQDAHDQGGPAHPYRLTLRSE